MDLTFSFRNISAIFPISLGQCCESGPNHHLQRLPVGFFATQAPTPAHHHSFNRSINKIFSAYQTLVLSQIWKSSMSITRHRKAKVCLQFNEMGAILKTYNKVLWGYTKWSLSLLGKQLSWKTIQRWWVTSVESWRVSMRNSKEGREFQEKVLVYSRGAKQRKCIAVGSVRLQQWCLRMYWMRL